MRETYHRIRIDEKPFHVQYESESNKVNISYKLSEVSDIPVAFIFDNGLTIAKSHIQNLIDVLEQMKGEANE